MIIERTVVTRHPIALPKPLYATLLSIDEFEECQHWIRPARCEDIEPNVPPVWYLRTPGEEDPFAIMTSDWCECEPDFDDYGPEDLREMPFGTGNRPALVFVGGLLATGAKLGDQFTVGRWPFTIISDELALCDEYISTEIFDEVSNDYEQSAIKERVDAWFADIRRRWEPANSEMELAGDEG